MSKQRPSTTTTILTPATDPSAASLDGWRQRVFKNTYTRHGRRIAVKRWSVKIQHQGIRRTVSLAAENRADAAVEARAMYQTILTQGWEVVPRSSRISAAAHAEFGTNPHSKTDVRYWKGRLLRRRHPSSLNAPASAELSVRIEHAGVNHYFPLATLSEDSAAARAREIYLSVVKAGWTAAGRRFPRELTVALHWAENPLAWTYATFHTSIGNDSVRSRVRAPQYERRIRVLIVEPDAGVRRALCRCVNSQAGFECVEALADAKDALRVVPRSAPQLALVNRNISPDGAHPLRERLQRCAPSLPILFFTTYEDSDQLFKATPGGASGYLLKRTAPERLFDPIAGVAKDRPLSAEQLAVWVRNYFQRVIQSLSADDSAREMARLTPREHEILGLVSKGYVDKEIAELLAISGWTVHGHLKRIFDKLGVHTRTEAAIKYLQK